MRNRGSKTNLGLSIDAGKRRTDADELSPELVATPGPLSPWSLSRPTDPANSSFGGVDSEGVPLPVPGKSEQEHNSLFCPNLRDGFRYHRLRKSLLGRSCLYFVVMILCIAWTFSTLALFSNSWVVEKDSTNSNSGLYRWEFPTEVVSLPTKTSDRSVVYIVRSGQTFALISTISLLLIIICLLIIACVPRLREYSFIPFLAWTSLALSCLFYSLTLLVFHTNFAHKCTYSYETTTPFHYQRSHSIADRCMWSYNINIRPKALDDSSNPLLDNYIWSFEYVLGYGYAFYVTGLGLILVSMAILFNFVFVIPNFDVLEKRRIPTASEEDLLEEMPRISVSRL